MLNKSRWTIAAVVVFAVGFAAFWAIPALMIAPGSSGSFGAVHERIFRPAVPATAAFRWDLNVTIQNPDDVQIVAYVPFIERPTRDAGRGVDAKIDLAINGQKAWRTWIYQDPVALDVQWPGVPSYRANLEQIDWSLLKTGSNWITIAATFTMPAGDHEKTGSVLLRAGPANFTAEYPDEDRDGVADVNQPIPWAPTWLAGAVISGMAGALVWRGGRR